jgi:hypothetical protein
LSWALGIVLMVEEEKPSIGGMPQSLRDRFGEAVNDLTQRRMPKNMKNNLAHKEVEKRPKRQKC